MSSIESVVCDMEINSENILQTIEVIDSNKTYSSADLAVADRAIFA
jgi:hypothetical protein